MIAVITVFTTIAYGAVHQPVIALFYVLTASMLVLWAVDGYVSGSMRFSRSLLQLPILGAAVYGLIQVIPIGTVGEVGGVAAIPRTISLDPFATQVSSLHFLALFIFFAVLLVLLDSASRLRRLVTFLMIFGFAYAFFAIIQSVLSPQKIYGIYERWNASPFGSFVNRHNFAAYMEMTLSLPLGLMFVGAVPKDKRLLFITAIALMGIALLLSGSRGGLIAFLGQVIVLVLLTTRGKSRSTLALRLGLSVLLIAAIIGGAVFVGGDTSLTRLADTASANDLSTGRSYIWRQTVDVISANLPFGAGLGAFGVAYTPHDALSGLERVEQAHNDYLQVLSDAGIPGLLLGLFFLIVFFKLGLASRKIENQYRRGIVMGAFAGCVAILIHSAFDFVLHTTAISVLFLVLLGIMVAGSSSYADDRADQQPGRHKRRSSGRVESINSGRKRSRSRSSEPA